MKLSFHAKTSMKNHKKSINSPEVDRFPLKNKQLRQIRQDGDHLLVQKLANISQLSRKKYETIPLLKNI
jgi:hypothetical protein